MSKIPDEWIELLFARMCDIYGEKWLSYIDKREYLIKPMWSSALIGLNAKEIKTALEKCRNLSDIPTPVEFYHYAKNIRRPHYPKVPTYNKGNPEVAVHYLNEIKERVHNKLRSGST